ncbi:MAG: hypothetical protein K2N38_12930 [Oscillospiraceae bacterium]|nr:hypothetical protein [Oscillospiraceae bacterium]
MKKIVSVIAAAAVALSLCACNKTNVSVSDIGSDGVPANPGESGGAVSAGESMNVGGDIVDDPRNLPPDDKQLTLLCCGDSFWGAGCGTDTGYYSIQSNIAGGGFNGTPYDCITYIDYATKQEVILCSDSSCKHDSERCTGIVPGGWRLSDELFFYKEHLYCLIADLDNEGAFSYSYSAEGYSDSYSAGGYYNDEYAIVPKLYRMDPDGTNRVLVYTFGEKEKVEHFAVGDGDCIWFITKEPTIERDEKTGATHSGSKNRALVRLDLNERDIVEQIPISYGDNIKKDFIGVCGSKIIFGGIAYPDGKSAMDYIDIIAPSPIVGDMSGWDEYKAFMSTCEYAFFTLDVTDKTIREIYRTGFDDVSLDYSQVGERLYIPTGEDYTSAFKLDLNTGGTGEYFVPEGYALDGFVGEHPLYITASGEYERCLYDPDTGEMKHWIFDTGTTNIIAMNSDSALVWYKTVGEEKPDGGFRNPYYLYAMITLDDLYNGRENFEPIDMLKRNV